MELLILLISCVLPLAKEADTAELEKIDDDVSVIASTYRILTYLITLKALHINDIKPSLNTKAE